MPRHPTIAALLTLLAASAHAQDAPPECTTTTTTTTTCRGSAAGLAAPGPEQAAPPPAYPSYPAYPQPTLQQPVMQPPVYQPHLYLQPARTHVEERPRYGLMITGLAVFGGSYLINAMIGYSASEWRFAVPVFGPLIFAGHETDRYRGNCHSCDSGDRFLWGMMVFDALVQATGVILFIVGAATKTRVTVFDNVAIVPGVTSGGAGLAALGRF
ncbi:MAG: hypothetical protein EXR72_13675 [Myxococcales bacterium]|nr:hypothetical protein [Myxococcales bacterium]